jgi:hypothetical protein
VINWNDNAKAAVREFADYIGESDKGERYLEHIAPKKTVADAVEYYGKTFVAGQWTHIRCGKDGKMLFASGETDSDNWQDSYLVCTRADFEAYVKEQEEPHFKATRENLEKIAKDAQGDFVEVEEGEKWTHTYFNIRCRIMDLDPDEFGTVVIIKNGGDYALAHPSKLKPIKPTISEDSKRQLELYVQYRVDKYGDYAMKSDLSDYLSYHDIVGVSAND